MAESKLPVWEDRQQPTAVLYGGNEDSCTVLPQYQDSGEDFADFANGYREDLQIALRSLKGPFTETLQSKGVDLAPINRMVADLAGLEAYPEHRFTVNVLIKNYSQVHRNAVNAGFFTRHMKVGDETVDAQAIELMDFVRLRSDFVHDSTAYDLSRHLAYGAALAIFQRHVRVQIDPQNSEPAKWGIWTGNIWKQQGNYYGYLPNEARAEMLALTACRELELVPDELDDRYEAPPVAEKYRMPWGYSFSGRCAILMDTLGDAAGLGEGMDIYRPLWKLCETDDANARQEVADIVARATKGGVQLAELDAVGQLDNRAVVELLAKIEEKADIDASRRASWSISVD